METSNTSSDDLSSEGDDTLAQEVFDPHKLLDNHLIEVPREQIIYRHLNVLQRLAWAEADNEELGNTIRQLKEENLQLQAKVGVGFNDLLKALNPNLFELLTISREDLIHKHLISMSCLTDAEGANETLQAALREAEETNASLKQQLRNRDHALHLVFSAAAGQMVACGIDPAGLLQKQKEQQQQQEEEAMAASAPEVHLEEAMGGKEAQRAESDSDAPSDPSSPPLMIQPSEECGMPHTIEEAMAPSREARVITDEDGSTILHVNKAWEELCGYTAEEATGKSLKIIQGPGTESALMKALMQAVRAQGACAEVKLTNYRKDGRNFCNRLRVTPLDSDSCGRRYLGVLTEVRPKRSSPQGAEGRSDAEATSDDVASSSPKRPRAPAAAASGSADPTAADTSAKAMMPEPVVAAAAAAAAVAAAHIMPSGLEPSGHQQEQQQNGAHASPQEPTDAAASGGMHRNGSNCSVGGGGRDKAEDEAPQRTNRANGHHDHTANGGGSEAAGAANGSNGHNSGEAAASAKVSNGHANGKGAGYTNGYTHTNGYAHTNGYTHTNGYHANTTNGYANTNGFHHPAVTQPTASNGYHPVVAAAPAMNGFHHAPAPNGFHHPATTNGYHPAAVPAPNGFHHAPAPNGFHHAPAPNGFHHPAANGYHHHNGAASVALAAAPEEKLGYQANGYATAPPHVNGYHHPNGYTNGHHVNGNGNGATNGVSADASRNGVHHNGNGNGVH